MSANDEAASLDAATRLERRWAILSVVVVVLLTVAAAYGGIHGAVMPQARVETADPTTLHIKGEFVEGNLGTALEADGSVTVRAVAQQYSFTPPCILVPADTPVTIRATSADVVHGFLIGGTNVNTMLVPGYVSSTRTRFAHPADLLMPCHEFCGTGHEGMWGRVKIIDRAAFLQRASGRRRLTCASR